jgi:aryl-alcohol dehydrogenase-like predicted oxidoreductase
MQVRPFGKTDLRVSALGLGCARIGGIFQGNAAGYLDLLSAARDAGITFFDTSDMYSQGESEKLVGQAFRKRRHMVVIASKAGYKLPGQRRLAARLKPFLRPLIRALKIKRSALPSSVRGAPSQDFSSAYLRGAVEASLRRLRTDYIDLLQLHSPPADVVARGEWQQGLEDLKRAGKIRYYGISVDTVEAGLAALEFPGVSSLQFVASLINEQWADALLPRAREKGLGVIARECLANGLLIKDEKDIDLSAFYSTPEERAARAQQLAAHRMAAAASGKSLATLALDHVLGLEGVSVSLVGARNRSQLEALLRQVPAPTR